MKFKGEIHKLFKRKLSGNNDQVEELIDKVDCLQRAVANLTRLVAEGYPRSQ
jgi:hypothetical protein